MTDSSPSPADLDVRYDVAPALTVRFTDTGAVSGSLTGRPAAIAGIVPLGEGRFGSADPQRPPDQMWVPLDQLRLEFLHAMVASAPCAAGVIVAAVAGSGTDAAPRRDDLRRLVDQLVAAGLLAPAGTSDWRARTEHGRADRMPWDLGPPPDPPPSLDLGDGRRIRRTNFNALVVTPDGFAALRPDGTVAHLLSALEVSILAAVRSGVEASAVHAAANADPSIELSRSECDERLRSLADRGLLLNLDEAVADEIAETLRRRQECYREAELGLTRLLDEERDRAARTGVKRPLVVAVDADMNPLLSLGMVVAYAKAFEGGRLTEAYCFAPQLYTAPHRLPNLFAALADWPTVFLFSDYIWTRAANLVMSAAIKENLPAALTIHGGPEVPRYEGDVERFYGENRGVDVGVRVEGEVTLAELLAALVPEIPHWSQANAVPDLSVLDHVVGLTYRSAEGPVSTGDRDRITDLDTIPSPYLTGEFDNIDRREADSVIFESNRGCPYGCTFCDWGSATLSRIRKFSLQRVLDEMEWAAKRGIKHFGLTDANFGILDRDVDIAEWAVELRRRHGVPHSFQVTYAKSRVQNLTKIVRVLAEAGIVTQAAISVQTMDTEVLKIVKRKNLEIDRHVPLVQEFEDLRLPLYSDIMVGLPGSNVGTTRGDLQFCIDREIHYRPNATQLLINSPMNEDAYKDQHGIVAVPGEYLIESRTYSKDDMFTMMDHAEYALMADRRGTLRELATYVRSEVGLPEVAFYEQLIEAGSDSRRWPFLGYLNTVAVREFVPPGSWSAVVEEVGDFMVRLGVPDDDALATVLAVQRAVIPMSGRSFPETVHLAHDYLSWHAAVRRARRELPEGRWAEAVDPLRSYGPGQLEIRDPSNSCGRVVGTRPRGSWEEVPWELDTPIARAVQRTEVGV